jgi:ABC-type polysaccharide/polyol phosphate transport system ATPase subunit
MSTLAICAEGLGKQYHVGERERYLALRDVLMRAVRSPLKLFRPAKFELMWALKDVSLQVKHGEVIGIIGRNGSGKTTLLKILSRITRPTTGSAEIYGSMRTLLEVGTGFHPELTGRENMYLSGAILGMSKREIERKFDTIIAFSGVERFIDTQLKHFSTGMQMRLAFAVAAHLEPDILLVDEVLAVGDLEFQKKCLGKMEEVSGSGRTILFVSHQMNQIRRLCKRVLWLEGGEIYRSGPTAAVLAEYEAALSSGQRNQNHRSTGIPTKARFVRWQIDGTESGSSNFLTTIGAVTIRFQVEVLTRIQNGNHGIVLYNGERQLMWGWATDGVDLELGTHEFCYTFPTLPLRPGPYSWLVSLREHGDVVDQWDCSPDMIIDTEVHQHPQDEWSGVLNTPCQFRICRSHEFHGDK